MKVKKKGNMGFTDIYTSNNPPSNTTAELQNKSHIIFVLSGNNPNLSYIRNNKLTKLGTVDLINKNLILTVKSDRNVIQAIDIFLKETTYYYDKELSENLIAYKEACEKRLEQKPQKQLPLKSKLYDEFKEQSTQSTTNNTIKRMVKKNNPTKQYIHKNNPSGRSILEIEVFNGFCYRLLLGERHPKVRGVHNSQGDRAGLISKVVMKFKSFHDLIMFYDELGESSLPQENLLKSEIVKVWVAAYVEEENDLHGGNYGIGPDGFCVKIDDDQSTWPLTSQYSEVDPKKGNYGYSVAPNAAFPVTEGDILDFPKLKDAKPRNWPDRSDSGAIQFNDLVKENKFIEDKYYMFLKRILIPNEVYENIGLTISSDKKRKQFVDHKCNKTNELKTVLLNIKEFQDYVIQNPNVIKQIKFEFSEYNKAYKKSGDLFLRVNLNQIDQNFNDINFEIYCKRPISESYQEEHETQNQNVVSFSHLSLISNNNDNNNDNNNNNNNYFEKTSHKPKKENSLAYSIFNNDIKSDQKMHDQQDNVNPNIKP